MSLAVACQSGLDDAPGQNGGSDVPPPVTLRQMVTGENTGVSKPIYDQDRDGVRDEADKCFTPPLISGATGVVQSRVNMHDGCATPSMPQVCRGDSAPPRAVLGPDRPEGSYYAGVDVIRRTADGHTVFEIRMDGGRDVDIKEECPDLDTALMGIFVIGDNYPIWTCRGREVPEAWVGDPGDSSYNRQARIDDKNPCFFDPAGFTRQII